MRAGRGRRRVGEESRCEFEPLRCPGHTHHTHTQGWEEATHIHIPKTQQPIPGQPGECHLTPPSGDRGKGDEMTAAHSLRARRVLLPYGCAALDPQPQKHSSHAYLM